MKVQNLDSVKTILEEHYICGLVLNGINPNRYKEMQYTVWSIAEDIFGKEWADEMTATVRQNYREGKYDE